MVVTEASQYINRNCCICGKVMKIKILWYSVSSRKPTGIGVGTCFTPKHYCSDKCKIVDRL